MRKGVAVETARGISTPGKPEAEERTVDLLVEAFRQGKPGAFDAIVRAHQDRIYSFCLRMLSDREEAQDAAQEVFLSAWRNLSGFRGESALSTWLVRIATNRCLNRIRQRNARTDREVRPGSAGGEEEELPFQPEGREEDRPDRVVQNAELRTVLERALGRLDPETRSLVLLSDVEGLSYEELSEAVGIPLGTVKSRLHRARMTLRRILAPVV